MQFNMLFAFFLKIVGESERIDVQFSDLEVCSASIGSLHVMLYSLNNGG